MKKLLFIVLIIITISLVAAPAVFAGEGDLPDPHVQYKNQKE